MPRLFAVVFVLGNLEGIGYFLFRSTNSGGHRPMNKKKRVVRRKHKKAVERVKAKRRASLEGKRTGAIEAR
jgi:hypothetical protein